MDNIATETSRDGHTFFIGFRNSMVLKLIVSVGIILLLSIFIWAYFNIQYHQKKIMDGIVAGTDKITNTVKLGTHYAMMLNSRDDITQIIRNIGSQPGIENIRIYNKEGMIKFSNRSAEVDMKTNIKDEACYICHRTDPPQSELELVERIRFFESDNGYRRLGVISPIYNEPGCSSGSCHVHPEGKKILGALDLVVSLDETDQGIVLYEQGIFALAGFTFLVTSIIIFVFLLRFVNHPIRRLIRETRRIAKGDYSQKVDIQRSDEIGQMARAINQMGSEIYEKEVQLNKKMDEYQTLFERVPCIITVQDRNYKLVQYNSEFKEKFDPEPGAYCYKAYKGRDEKCIVCPVERTFQDGQSHYSEESGINKDGTLTHWIVRTSPITNADGEIVAAMEMCLDITPRRHLEERLEQSEKKYSAIFANIPNPVFVLDTDTLEILDCNESMTAVYGFDRNEVVGHSFLLLFHESEREEYSRRLRNLDVLDRVKQYNKTGGALFVNIRVSPSEYSEQKVLLVTTSDITQRLEAEQQLTQASKMATLGEMATGVAHELNQPLTVIKTASSFLLKKFNNADAGEPDPINTMTKKISTNVDRASKIINHMRQFARKSEMTLEKVQVNEVIEKALDMFSQQLKVRGIEVERDLEPDLPVILAEPGRLEQVFVNLLINARHAIEDKADASERDDAKKTISLRTHSRFGEIVVEVCDSGIGIPTQITDKIFEPFFTTKEVGKGTGLGLSISYGIVKDFGGHIHVVPSEDQGACFVITFPTARKKS